MNQFRKIWTENNENLGKIIIVQYIYKGNALHKGDQAVHEFSYGGKIIKIPASEITSYNFIFNKAVLKIFFQLFKIIINLGRIFGRPVSGRRQIIIHPVEREISCDIVIFFCLAGNWQMPSLGKCYRILSLFKL